MAGNYSISPAALTASIAASGSTYGAALAPGVVTFTGLVGADAVGSTAAVNTAALSTSLHPVAGSYTQTAGALAGLDAGNYSFAGFTSAANYSISPAALTAAIAASGSTYGAAL